MHQNRHHSHGRETVFWWYAGIFPLCGGKAIRLQVFVQRDFLTEGCLSGIRVQGQDFRFFPCQIEDGDSFSGHAGVLEIIERSQRHDLRTACDIDVNVPVGRIIKRVQFLLDISIGEFFHIQDTCLSGKDIAGVANPLHLLFHLRCRDKEITCCLRSVFFD